MMGGTFTGTMPNSSDRKEVTGVRFESALEKKKRQQQLKRQQQQQQQQEEEEARARAAADARRKEEEEEERAAAAAMALQHAQTNQLQASLATNLSKISVSGGASYSSNSNNSNIKIGGSHPTDSINQATYDFRAHDKEYIQAMEAAEYVAELIAQQAQEQHERDTKGPLGLGLWPKAHHLMGKVEKRWEEQTSQIVTTIRSVTTTKQQQQSSTTKNIGDNAGTQPSISTTTTTTTSSVTPESPQFSGQDLAMAFEGHTLPPQSQQQHLEGGDPSSMTAPSWTQQQQQQQPREEAAPAWCRNLQQQHAQQQQQPPRYGFASRSSSIVDHGLDYRNAEYSSGVSNNSSSSSSNNNKTASAVMGASLVGGVAGLVLAGPVVGVLGAAGVAYQAATKDGMISKSLRTAGSATSTVVSAAAQAITRK